MPVHPTYDVTLASVEWYTPERYIRLVRDVLGDIDLDPASCEMAQTIVHAHDYYTKETNGFFRHWYGRVFLNPPYGKVDNISEQERWTAKLIHEYTLGNVKQAICLTNASDCSTKWYQRLCYYPHCMTNHRLRFWRYSPDNSRHTRSMVGSMFTYFGPDPRSFYHVFQHVGACLPPAVNTHPPELFDSLL